jgi:DNA polymerase-3 subunit gamma/tau
VSLQQLKDTWPEVLEAVQKASMNAWTVVFNAQVRSLDGDVLTLTFSNQTDQAKFKEVAADGTGVSAYLRAAIVELLGLRVKFMAPLAAAPVAPVVTAPPVDDEAPEPTEPDQEPGGWAVAAIPPSAPTEEQLRAESAAARRPSARVAPAPTAESARYGESVVREILGASFIEEQPVVARVVPKDF